MKNSRELILPSTLNAMVVAASILALSIASARVAIGQQTRESAVKSMRQLDPKELDPTYNRTAPFAQKLVDDELESHPRVLLIGMHVTPPGYSTNVIIASNFGRIGKLADKDDLRVINTGVPNFDVEPAGSTYEAELPIHAGSGHIIGAVSIVVNFKPGDNQDEFKREAKTIAKNIDRQINTLDQLFGPSKDGARGSN
jgi:hypothetical protein